MNKSHWFSYNNSGIPTAYSYTRLFYVGVGDLNSSPRVCTANALTTEPFPPSEVEYSYKPMWIARSEPSEVKDANTKKWHGGRNLCWCVDRRQLKTVRTYGDWWTQDPVFQRRELSYATLTSYFHTSDMTSSLMILWEAKLLKLYVHLQFLTVGGWLILSTLQAKPKTTSAGQM